MIQKDLRGYGVSFLDPMSFVSQVEGYQATELSLCFHFNGSVTFQYFDCELDWRWIPLPNREAKWDYLGMIDWLTVSDISSGLWVWKKGRWISIGKSQFSLGSLYFSIVTIVPSGFFHLRKEKASRRVKSFCKSVQSLLGSYFSPEPSNPEMVAIFSYFVLIWL